MTANPKLHSNHAHNYDCDITPELLIHAPLSRFVSTTMHSTSCFDDFYNITLHNISGCSFPKVTTQKPLESDFQPTEMQN